MQTFKYILQGIAGALFIFAILAGITASAATTSFSSPTLFKIGGNGTQIVPLAPSWSVNIPLSPPQNVGAASSTTGGSLGSGMPLYFEVAAQNPTGTTTPSSEIATTTLVGSSQINLTWTPVPGANLYAVFFSTTTNGAENALFYATTTNAYNFTSTSSPIYSTPLGFPTAFALQLSNATSPLSINGTNQTPQVATTGAIGGGALAAGQCTTATSTLANANTVSSSTVFMTTPQKYPGSGVVWQSYALNTTQFVTEVCALLAITPTSVAYNVRAY